MVIEEIKNIQSGKNELRNFGMTVGIFLGILGALFLWREKDYYICFILFSAAFLFLGLALPISLRPVHKAWMTLSTVLGWFMTGLILSVLFYVVITTIGLLSRLFGMDFLSRKFNRNLKSYWIPRGATKSPERSYESQF